MVDKVGISWAIRRGRRDDPGRDQPMFAAIAAGIFGLALLLDLLDVRVSDAFTNTTLVTLGLLFLALHFGGVADRVAASRTRTRTTGSGYRRRTWRRRYGR
jgi:hypothetical protein